MSYSRDRKKAPPRASSLWPPSRTAALRSLMATRKFSYGQMAYMLGITRNAVAGKVGRIRKEEKSNDKTATPKA